MQLHRCEQPNRAQKPNVKSLYTHGTGHYENCSVYTMALNRRRGTYTIFPRNFSDVLFSGTGHLPSTPASPTCPLTSQGRAMAIAPPAPMPEPRYSRP